MHLILSDVHLQTDKYHLFSKNCTVCAFVTLELDLCSFFVCALASKLKKIASKLNKLGDRRDNPGEWLLLKQYAHAPS